MWVPSGAVRPSSDCDPAEFIPRLSQYLNAVAQRDCCGNLMLSAKRFIVSKGHCCAGESLSKVMSVMPWGPR